MAQAEMDDQEAGCWEGIRRDWERDLFIRLDAEDAAVAGPGHVEDVPISASEPTLSRDRDGTAIVRLGPVSGGRL